MEKLVNTGGKDAGKCETADFLKIKTTSRLAYSFDKAVFQKSEL